MALLFGIDGELTKMSNATTRVPFWLRLVPSVIVIGDYADQSAADPRDPRCRRRLDATSCYRFILRSPTEHDAIGSVLTVSPMNKIGRVGHRIAGGDPGRDIRGCHRSSVRFAVNGVL